MARLSRSSVARLGAAVRGFEAASKVGEGGRENVAARVVAMARITSIVDSSATPPYPFRYTGDILSGFWDDAQDGRDPAASSQAIWATEAQGIGDRVAVLKVGEHWEAVPATGGDSQLPGNPDDGDIPVYDDTSEKYVAIALDNLIRYDTTSKQLQVKVAGVWAMIEGGQAVPFPP